MSLQHTVAEEVEAFRSGVLHRGLGLVEAEPQGIRGLLRPGDMGAWRKRLHRLLAGWAAYFSHGTCAQAYEAIDRQVYDRVRHFLRRRLKVQGRGTKRFSREHVFGELQVLRLRRVRRAPPPWAVQ